MLPDGRADHGDGPAYHFGEIDLLLEEEKGGEYEDYVLEEREDGVGDGGKGADEVHHGEVEAEGDEAVDCHGPPLELLEALEVGRVPLGCRGDDRHEDDGERRDVELDRQRREAHLEAAGGLQELRRDRVGRVRDVRAHERENGKLHARRRRRALEARRDGDPAW